MTRRPLLSITTLTCASAAALSGLAMALFLAGGRPSWAIGVAAGWLAGGINAVLLARRVSLLTGRSSVFGFLYGMGSRFALIALVFLGAVRLAGANPLGFVIGLALVVLMEVPAALWSLKRVPA